MKESIHKYFQIGTIQWMSHPPAKYKLLDSIKALICDDFFDAIEITKIEDETTRQLVKKMLEESHIKVCYGAQPRLLGHKLNPNDIDEAKRKKAVDTLIKAIDEAEYLGAKGIAFLSGNWEEKTRDIAYEKLLKTTRELCDYAAEKGMMVELEVFDYDMDKCSLIGPADYAAKFAVDIRKTNNNFGLIADLSHFPTTYETSSHVIHTLKPFITHFHIGNAVVKKGLPAYGDKHPRFGFPNSANNIEELVDFFNILKAEGFYNSDNPYVMSFEVTPFGDEDADIILANTKRVINRAWALAED